MRWLVVSMLGLSLMACTDGKDDLGDIDADGDGYNASMDCNDADASIYPGADEICDEVDNDCDTEIDEEAVDAIAYFADSDGDTFGDVDTMQMACAAGEGWVEDNTDCDDTNPDVNPGATEVCDSSDTDEDCDGLVNDADDSVDLSTTVNWYLDSDADGYGAEDSEPLASCSDPSDSSNTYSAENTDCNDKDDAINPGATEVCDPYDTDEDCDGMADNLDPDVDSSTQTLYFVDADMDTFGDDTDTGTLYCDDPSTDDSKYSVNADDCDDRTATINPDAKEVCDDADVDEDCDGLADDLDDDASGTTKTKYYVDADKDGYGEISRGTPFCDDPSTAADLWSTEASDCDDTDPKIYPGASDTTADGVDSDCDGKELCYVNTDMDSHRIDTTVASSDADCDDAGEALATMPSGDCDDRDKDTYPGATEIVGDGKDQSCDGAETCYVNADGDAYRIDTTVSSTDDDCSDAGEALATVRSGDCDDSDPKTYPGAAEVVADGKDQSCDGSEICYVNGDGDSYRTNTTVTSTDDDCSDAREALASMDAGDCDDTDPKTYPGATEIVADGIDQSCDGSEICYADADNDRYRVNGRVASADEDCTDSGEALATEPSGDCDDSDAKTFPGATEVVADGKDQSCDGSEICYVNGDGDSYRIDTTVTSADDDCSDAREALASMAAGDCDDTDPKIYPGATEIVADGIDQSCDGREICYKDKDDDGYHTSTEITSLDTDCSDSGEALASEPGGDCDDDKRSVYPGAPEIPQDGIDQDCDRVDAPYKVSDLSAGELIITEIMFNPAKVSDSVGEWFEVYNNAGGTVNLKGLVVKDNASSFTVSSSGLEFDDGEYVVFGIDGRTSANGGVKVDYDYSGPVLSNSGDVVSLSYGSTVFDSVTYTSKWAGGSGISLSLCPDKIDSLDNDTSTNWIDATTSYGLGDLGTPGDENDVCVTSVGHTTGTATVTFSPNFLIGQKIVLSSSVTLDKFGVDFVSGSSTMKMALYDNSGASGGPGRLIASTGSRSTTANTSLVFDVTDVSLSAGTYYIMAVYSSSARTLGTSTSTPTWYRSHTYSTTPPSTFGTASTYPASRHFNFYLWVY